MRRAVTRPIIYLALVASFALIPDFANQALLLLTLPWNIVLFYLVGMFGANVSALMNNQEAATLGIAAALAQAAFLAYLGDRADREKGARPVSPRFFAVALVIVLAPGLSVGGLMLMEYVGAQRSARVARDPRKIDMGLRQAKAIDALGALLRAEYAWADAHPGEGYVTSLSSLAPRANPDLHAAIVEVEAMGYQVKLARRSGWVGRSETFRLEVVPVASEPFAYGYYADESGFIHHARMRENPSEKSPLIDFPRQFGFSGFTPDGSAIVVQAGVRVRTFDLRTGLERKAVIVPPDSIEVSLDSAGRPVFHQEQPRGPATYDFGSPSDARVYLPPPEGAGRLASSVYRPMMRSGDGTKYLEAGWVIDSTADHELVVRDCAIAIWDARSGERVALLHPTTPQQPFMTNADGRWVLTRVVGGINPHPQTLHVRVVPKGSPDAVGTVTVWDVARGRVAMTLGSDFFPRTLDDDGRIMGVRDSTLEWWDATTGTKTSSIMTRSGGQRLDHAIFGAMLSRDYKTAARFTSGGVLKVWEVESGRETRQWNVMHAPDVR